MTYRVSLFLYKLRFLFGGTLIIASLFAALFLLAAIEPRSAKAQDTSSSRTSQAKVASNNPNVVAGGMTKAASSLGQTMEMVSYEISDSAQIMASATIRGSKTIAHGTQAGAAVIARGLGRGIGAVGRAVGNGASFVIGIPGDVIGFVTNASPMRAVIRPSDHVEVPIIDPNSPELKKALAALPATETQEPGKTASNRKTRPIWPIHGQITTLFGVNHWPYQPTHTGIDISDGRPSGVTPVKAFRQGRVINTVHSNYSLGNHVIVDHGNGVTSVYAHLHSISVKVGQNVDTGTTLGLEGTTGVSTDTHLHFEIRVHGQAADPRHFIDGLP